MYKYLEKNFYGKKGFSALQKVLKRLGSPHDKLKVIHVAGTNGKGSTCAMLNNILISQGYSVGLFTSPHIHEYNERIKINNVNISNVDFESEIMKIKRISEEVLDDGSLSFFEIMTAVAFDYFYINRIDFVIIETGIGGRLDSTNVVKSPILSIITSISYDHTNILGNDILEIAQEKAGIIKKNRPVVLYSQSKEVYNEINMYAKKLNSRLYYLDDCLEVSDINLNLKYTTFSVAHKSFVYNDIHINLIGNYQILNACNTLLAISALKDLDIKISSEAVYKGLLNTKWPGRMEIIKFKNKMILLEGAHNSEGIINLSTSLNTYFDNKKILMIIGFLADKDYLNMSQAISQAADILFITKPDSPRSATPQEINGFVSHKSKLCFDNCKTAFDEAIYKYNSDLICVTGSLYLVSDIRQYILEKGGLEND